MKIIFKIFLTILFVLFSLILALSITFRFQLLNPNFWKNNFNTNGTYLSLSTIIKNNLEEQVSIGGGIKSDAGVLTNLVTPANLKNVITNNIDNLLGYVNGDRKEILVYIPVDKIPLEILNIGNNKISKQMKLRDVLAEFNIEGISVSQIDQIKNFGSFVNISLLLSLIFDLIIIFVFVKLTDSDKKITSMGVAFVLTGVIILIVSGVTEIVNNITTQNISMVQNLAAKISGIITSPILKQVIKLWTIEGVILFAIGILFFIIKKPYNQSK